METLTSSKHETDPLSGLVIVFHNRSYPKRVVEHPFDEKVYGVEFSEHGKVMPISELWRLRIWSQVGLWRSVVVWLVFWLLLGPVLRQGT
jgi:hypothetical protein